MSLGGFAVAVLSSLLGAVINLFRTGYVVGVMEVIAVFSGRSPLPRWCGLGAAGPGDGDCRAGDARAGRERAWPADAAGGRIALTAGDGARPAATIDRMTFGAASPDLLPGAHNAVATCLSIHPGERVALVADEASWEVAASLEQALIESDAEIDAVLIEAVAARPIRRRPAGARGPRRG